MKDDLFLLLFVLMLTLGVAVRRPGWQKLKELAARGWPLSQGKIEFGTVIERRTRYFSYYVAQMAYSYSVQGDYYSGYYEKTFWRERSAQKFADELKGLRAFIRHKPGAPGTSSLLVEDQQSVWPLQT